MTYPPKIVGNSPLLYCLALQVLASITTNGRTFVAYGANEDIAVQLGLTTSTVLPFPSQTMSSSDTNNYLKEKWTLRGGVSFGEDRLAFVSDPVGGGSESNSSSDSGSKSGSSVLSVKYPAGSYSHGTGGAQFYSTFGDKEGFEAMLLSYDIAFESDFDWNKGGKLPGLRGGPVLNSCSGGREPSGDDCFSSRLMWRKNGEGEVYAYIPQQQSPCDQSGVICNSDYGFSLGRGKFSFASGKWQNVAVYTKMNNPPSESNGEIRLYFEGEEIFSFTNLKIRTSDAVTAGGMYFSTFFGGGDSSYATDKQVHTFYRNIQMFGGSGAGNSSSSNSTESSGSSVPASSSTGNGNLSSTKSSESSKTTDKN